MNKRIEKIASYIEAKDKVIDVGCELATLGEILAKRNIKSFACDVNSKIIYLAQERIKMLNLQQYITFFISDGLKNIFNIDVNTLVIAGMGTKNIIKILENSNISFDKLIILSHNDHELLRKNIVKLNYIIYLEEIFIDKNKLYNLIIFKNGTKKYNKKDLLLGINHVNLELYKKRNQILLKEYKKLYKYKHSKELLNKIKLLEES